MNFTNRDVVSIKDFSKQDLEKVFSIAGGFAKNGYDRKLLKGKRVGLLFYEPSTRTRMSFDTAAQTIGADTIWFAGPEGDLRDEGRDTEGHDRDRGKLRGCDNPAPPV
jgi:aspartate carbamoyltransferase catalytic subunit